MAILPSVRIPLAFALGVTLIAWRVFEILPEYSTVRTKMMGWMLLGAGALTIGCFWELLRWYQRMDRRYECTH